MSQHDSSPSKLDLEKAPLQADRLLNGMSKVISHDLPNQLVVLQSLLQLLSEEEANQFSEDGREYVRRLLNATRQANGMVRFLKEMARLNAFTSVSEMLALADLARELQGELRRLNPRMLFEFDWQWKVPAIRGDAFAYGRAILELCAGFINPRGAHCRISARSELRGESVEVTFLLAEGNVAAFRGNSQTLEERMEFILAREWLALCGATLQVARPSAEVASFSIAAPNR